MEIFISWSGSDSHRVALALRDWLPHVIQQVQPFVSSEDLEKGKRWIIELDRMLESTSEGIICVTRASQGAPWLNYEAGALAKATHEASIWTALLDLAQHEVVGPLGNFQHTDLADKSDVMKLLRSINSKCAAPLTERVLGHTFEREWPDLEQTLNDIRAGSSRAGSSEPSVPERRSLEDMIGEVLQRVRELEPGAPRPLRVTTPVQQIEVEESDPDDPVADRIIRHLGLSLQEASEKATRALQKFSEGDRVVHQTYGHGQITRIKDRGRNSTVEIEFDGEGKRRKFVLAAISLTPEAPF